MNTSTRPYLVCRHGMTITRGCARCLGENDWRLIGRRSRFGMPRRAAVVLLLALTAWYVSVMVHNTTPTPTERGRLEQATCVRSALPCVP